MQFAPAMRYLLAFLVAMLGFAVGVDGHARPGRIARATAKVKRTAKRAKRRHGRLPARTSTPLAAQHDEVVLAPAQLKQLQSNLVDGGYLRSTVDGRLGPRTRRALADFQREYHLTGTGSLDRPTAEALLGRDALGSPHHLATAR